jgi:hypothetical protein
MYEWTAEDQIELEAYEKTLSKSEWIRKHAGWIVGGVIGLVLTGFVTLAVLMASA